MQQLHGWISATKVRSVPLRPAHPSPERRGIQLAQRVRAGLVSKEFKSVRDGTWIAHLSSAMKPGDVVPWHYHKAPSYVILRRGTLTEQHFDPQTGQCVSEKVTAGSAFVEPPGLVHHVTNTGNEKAVIWWSTLFPKSDGVVEFTPAFRVGGVYPVPPPNCSEAD
jgi:quercetin dioxygenase-like cupin family protein